MDYPQSLAYILKCRPRTDAQSKIYDDALDALNQDGSFAGIAAVLCKSPVFRKHLPEFKASIPPSKKCLPEFKVPAAKMLGKRTPPKQQQQEEKKTSPVKRQATEQAAGASSSSSGCRHLTCKRAVILTGVTVQCVVCLARTKDAQHCSSCKKYLCSACHDLLAADTDEQATMSENATTTEQEEEGD